MIDYELQLWVTVYLFGNGSENKLIGTQRLGTINNPYFKSTQNKKEILVTWWHVRGGMGRFLKSQTVFYLFIYLIFLHCFFCCLKSHLAVNYISFLDLSFLERLLFFTHLTCLYVTHCALTGKVSHFEGKLHLWKWSEPYSHPSNSPPHPLSLSYPPLLSIKLVDSYYKW